MIKSIRRSWSSASRPGAGAGTGFEFCKTQRLLYAAAVERCLSLLNFVTARSPAGRICNVLNWALAKGYLLTSSGASREDVGDIQAGGNRQTIYFYSFPDCNIRYSGGGFTTVARMDLPGTTNYAMDTHPVVNVTWYGAVAFCNWLSQMQGLLKDDTQVTERCWARDAPC